MTIQLHDTLQGKKVPFEPLIDGEVTMYLCGPTVYNSAIERTQSYQHCNRESQRIGIHKALHEQLTTFGIGRYDGDESALIKFGRELIAFLDLFDGLAGLKSDRGDRHIASSEKNSIGRKNTGRSGH